MMRTGVSLDSIKTAFDASWDDNATANTLPRGKGFKPFSRWHWYAAPRVGESGHFEEGGVWEQALLAAKEHAYAESSNRSSEDGWNFVGHDTPDGLGGCGRINRAVVRPGNPDQWWACAPAGGLWRSNDGGSSWATSGTEDLASIGISDVAFHPSDDNIMYLATGDGDYGDTRSIGVLKSLDGGLTWEATGLAWSTYMGRTISRILVHPLHPDTVLAASSLGVYRTIDGGTTWTRTLTGDYASMELQPGHPDVVLAGQFGNNVVRSTDGGATWDESSIDGNDFGISRIALAFAPSAADTVYAIAGAMSGQGLEGFYRSIDAGMTWDLQADSPNLLGWTVAGSDPGGQSWYDLCIAVDPVDPLKVWTGGVNLWGTEDGGASWNCAGHWYGGGDLARLHADQHSIEMRPDGSLLIGNDGGVYTFDPSTGEATDRSTGLSITQIYRAATDPESMSRVLIGTQDNGTFMRSDGVWSHVLDGDGFTCQFHPSASDVLYASLYYGQVFRSDDGGNAFVEIAGNSGEAAHSQGAWLTPFVTNPYQPDHIYVGKNTVYHSTDRGQTWNTLGTIPGSDLTELAVSSSNPNYIYAVKERVMHRSTDGQNFELISAGNGFSWITKVLIDPNDSEHLWIALSNYSDTTKVLESTDAGLNWVSRSTGLPPAPVNDLIGGFGGELEMMAATDVGIYHTLDGQTWERYSTGLPTVWVTDLMANHGTGEIYAATYGRGMYVMDFPVQPVLDAALGRIITPRGTVCGDSVTLALPIYNRGTSAITTMELSYGIFGGASSDTAWSGLIAVGDSIHLSLNALPRAGALSDASIIISSINGGADEVITNNTRSIEFRSVAEADGELLVVRFANDCFGAQNGWSITDGTGAVIAHSSWITPLEVALDTVCLAQGCYQFHAHQDQLSGYESLATDCTTPLEFELLDPDGNAFLSSPSTGAIGNYAFCIPALIQGGCTDQYAPNFDPDALFNDGTCEATCYPLTLTVQTDCNGQELGWSLLNSSGLPIFGVTPGTLQSQTQYEWDLCQFSGCWSIDLLDAGGDGLAGCSSAGGESAFVLLTSNGDTLYYGEAEDFGGSLSLPACLPHPFVPGCMDLTGCDFNPLANSPTPCNISCYGCNDPVACNYDSLATKADGSCIYPSGCTDPSGCNYDVFALCDDGGCNFASPGYQCNGNCLVGVEELWFPDADLDGYGELEAGVLACIPPGDNYVLIGGDCNDDNNQVYPGAPVQPLNEDVNCDGYVASNELDACAPDLNGDDVTAIEDLLNLLSEFGCTSLCQYDIDGNGSVTSSDLLVLLAAYGSPCN